MQLGSGRVASVPVRLSQIHRYVRTRQGYRVYVCAQNTGSGAAGMPRLHIARRHKEAGRAALALPRTLLDRDGGPRQSRDCPQRSESPSADGTVPVLRKRHPRRDHAVLLANHTHRRMPIAIPTPIAIPIKMPSPDSALVAGSGSESQSISVLGPRRGHAHSTSLARPQRRGEFLKTLTNAAGMPRLRLCPQHGLWRRHEETGTCSKRRLPRDYVSPVPPNVPQARHGCRV